MDFGLASEHFYNKFEGTFWAKLFYAVLKHTSLDQLAIHDVTQQTNQHVDLLCYNVQHTTLAFHHKLLRQTLHDHQYRR